MWADRVDGLRIEGNTIEKVTEQGESLYPKAPLFEFTYCRNVEIRGNRYLGDHEKSIEADTATRFSLIEGGNSGF